MLPRILHPQISASNLWPNPIFIRAGRWAPWPASAPARRRGPPWRVAAQPVAGVRACRSWSASGDRRAALQSPIEHPRLDPAHVSLLHVDFLYLLVGKKNRPTADNVILLTRQRFLATLPVAAPPGDAAGAAQPECCHADQTRAALFLPDRLAADQLLGALRAGLRPLRGLRATARPDRAASGRWPLVGRDRPDLA